MTRRPLFSAALAWLGGILILASGCMDQSPTAALLDTTTVSDRDGRAVLPQGVTPVQAAVKFEAGSYSATVNPAGGSIDFAIGTLVFPKGAVDRATTITAVVNGSTLAVEFGPHGLTFPADAQPVLSFRAAGIVLPQSPAIYYLDDDGNVLEDLGGTFNPATGTFSAALEHFSPYILGAS